MVIVPAGKPTTQPYEQGRAKRPLNKRSEYPTAWLASSILTSIVTRTGYEGVIVRTASLS
jgi:hypothetical protein